MAYFPKFYFNEKSGECESFVYGGCGGNDNRFGTLEDCEKRCITEGLKGKGPKFMKISRKRLFFILNL